MYFLWKETHGPSSSKGLGSRSRHLRRASSVPDPSLFLRKRVYRRERSCFGVSSQFSVAHCPKVSFSMVSLHSPPFFNSIVASLPPLTSKEINRLKSGS